MGEQGIGAGFIFEKAPYALIAIVCGAGLVAQAGINANLAPTLGHPLRAALASFVTGTGMLIFPALISGPAWTTAISQAYRMVERDRSDILMFCGGPLGAFFVASGVVLSPRVGFALFFVTVVTGQLIMSVIYDKFGFYHTEKQPVGIYQMVGVVLSIGGAVMFQGRNLSNGSFDGLAFVGVLAGALLIIQSSFNKRLSKALGSPWRGALVSFFIGSLALVIVCVIESAISDRGTDNLGEGSEWWMWMGGPIGAAVLGAAFILVPSVIGFVLTFASVVLGELIGGLVLDEVDAFGLGRREATGMRGAGIATVLLGMVLVSYSSATRKKESTHAEKKNSSPSSQPDPKNGGGLLPDARANPMASTASDKEERDLE